MAKKVALISLGCSKNLVESEQMLCALEEAGFELADDPKGADAVVVNTCGFIDSAKAEAVDVILEMAELKKRGELGAIVAAGCLAERYKGEILAELPEIDAVVGVGAAGIIAEAVKSALERQGYVNFPDIDAPISERGRVLTTPSGFAYVKISEGCDNRCAYCVIPAIRGRYRSRRMEDILSECRILAESGAKELILVAQDTTRYGTDLYGKRALADLLKEISAIGGVEWIRVHYLYPDGIDDALLELFANDPKILHYFDIPLQHVSDRLLDSMRRRYSGNEARELIRKIREKMPDSVVRTSMIVGLPGETDEDFEALCEFLKEMRLERVGVFPYSAEEGTEAALMEGQIDEDIKLKRLEAIYALQERVMERFNKKRRGRVLKVLCEEYNPETKFYSGRSFAESPEVDGRIFFKSDKGIEPGSFVNVLIEGSIETDLTGRAI